MRVALTSMGFAAIVAYALYGAALINDWAVTAASGMPLPDTVQAMEAAGQPYSVAAGYTFGALGVLFALGWAIMALIPRRRARGEGVVTWAGVVAAGAPAYVVLSFGNLNSVGDTFHEWNAADAFMLEAPLYAISAIAFAVAIAAPILVAAHSRRRGARVASGA